MGVVDWMLILYYMAFDSSNGTELEVVAISYLSDPNQTQIDWWSSNASKFALVYITYIATNICIGNTTLLFIGPLLKYTHMIILLKLLY